MNRLILLAVLILAGGWNPTSAADAVRLGHDVVPTFQAVALEVDADRTDYRGSVTITLRVREATDHFDLHAQDMELTSVALEGPEGTVDARHERVDAERVRIVAAEALSPGEHTLRIAFEGPFNTQAVALYRMEQDGAGFAFTQFEADDARGAFPCFDEPGFKIPWQLTVKVPEAHIAVSNTPVENQTTSESWTTFVFQKTRPLPTYLIALATGPLETVEMPGLGVPARIVTLPGRTGLTAIAIEQTPPILRALERYFGQPYPFEKLDFIAIPEYWPGAMEHPGAITYASSILLLDAASASLAQRRFLAKVISHELAHMWFGDLVTMQWWDDLWLNESFADWMGDKITHQVFARFRMDLEVIDDAQGVMATDASPAAVAIRRKVKSTDTLLQDVGTYYNKGKAVLDMFEAWIGPETFREGVLAYLAANAWGNATADDLWKALDAASGGRVSAPLASFIDQPGVPLIEVESLGEGRVRLSQSRFATAGAELEAQLWSLPVTLRYSTGNEATTRVVLLDSATTVVDLGDELAWIYPKADARGYYRWRMSDEALSSLTADASARLTEAERMDLVGNLAAQLGAGTLDGGAFLAALERLAADPEPMVVASVLDHFDDLQRAFVPADLEPAFAAYLRRALRPALHRLGPMPRDGESETATLVRPRLLFWLGDNGQDEEILRFAEEKAAAYLEDPGSVPPSIASVCLNLVSMNGDAERFEMLRQRFETAATPTERARYLGSLGWFRDPTVVERALDYSFSGPLRTNELFSIPRRVRQTAAGRQRAYVWLTRNYAQLGERLPDMYQGFLPLFAGGCSAERLESAQAFFSRPEHQAAGTERALGRVAAQVNECLTLRAREGQSVRTFLETAES